ncbi:sugar phosphate isomerase/epimerase family protein [Persicitalea jodogahamensis]|uniref:Sugar phosphate isomerase n=1 Tax=Persicitalea jodogahamensis TaxID=402147 RepID=A0A8J3G9Q1_9BACT|nr:sugar phosphate isomerase/epimerase [Persicitalea jodogahamensis]GHB65032.1 sugar phosphate isomerase [Persicitalea jodogahamensis]
MDYNRRLFLKAAGFASLGAVAYPLLSCDSGGDNTSDSDSTALAGTGAVTKIDNFGIQLYSVRDIIGKDPKGVLKQIADLGYKEIESYQGDQGVFWGMTPKEFKAYLDELGMKIVSTHADTTKDLEKLAGECAEAGLTYVLQPYIGPQKTIDEWKKRAEEFNQRGEICNKAGVRFGYHNHDYSFKELDGQIPQEILLDNTDPAKVMYELDMCWIAAANKDIEPHLQKYAGRYDLCHVKDFQREPEFHQTDLGKGVIDYAKVLKVAQETGMKHFIVEQEEYPESVMASMAHDADYMKALVI